MPILIPNPNLIFPTTKPTRKPAVAGSGMTNPAPCGVVPVGTSSAGNPIVAPTSQRSGYYGFNIRPHVPQGADSDDEALGCVVGVIISGFTGVTPGAEVYIDPTARPAPGAEGTFSGLTHTVPAGGIGEAIGVGVTPTKIWFYPL